MKKRRWALALFISIFLRNRSLSDARWFCGRKQKIGKGNLYLRSFGHQGALYYVFLASDPLKTSREYAVFTLRIRGPKVCTRETSRQTQRVSAFFVLIAPNDRITSYIAWHWRPGQNFMMFQRTKNETWFSKNGNIKNLVQKDKNGAVVGLYVYIFLLLLVLNLV